MWLLDIEDVMKILPPHASCSIEGFKAEIGALFCLSWKKINLFFVGGIQYCQRTARWLHQSDIISAAQLLNVPWRNVQGDPAKWIWIVSSLSTNKNNNDNGNNNVPGGCTQTIFLREESYRRLLYWRSQGEEEVFVTQLWSSIVPLFIFW